VDCCLPFEVIQRRSDCQYKLAGIDVMNDKLFEFKIALGSERAIGQASGVASSPPVTPQITRLQLTFRRSSLNHKSHPHRRLA
jgi:hypothetical protein